MEDVGILLSSFEIIMLSKFTLTLLYVKFKVLMQDFANTSKELFLDAIPTFGQRRS